MSSTATLNFRPVSTQDVPKAYELESAGYPADEAASLEALETRQRDAGPYFLGAYTEAGELIGFTCATLTSSATLTHESMSTHEPDGPFVAIHSVCVSGLHRRKGVALALVKAYLARLAQIDSVIGARLIAHDNLIPLYAKAGFQLVGESSVVHGSEKWYEMKVDFDRPDLDEKRSLLEDAEDEGTIRNPGKKFSSFKGGLVADLVDTASQTNRADLFCPRAECRCLLLKRGSAKFVRPRSDDFDLPPLPRPVDSPASAPLPLSSRGYWSVDSPLAFENVGFSRNAPPPPSNPASTLATANSAATPTIKYLICADCDHGPLGWHDTEGRDLGLEVAEENEGQIGKVRKGREFLLAADRLRYRIIGSNKMQ